MNVTLIIIDKTALEVMSEVSLLWCRVPAPLVWWLLLRVGLVMGLPEVKGIEEAPPLPEWARETDLHVQVASSASFEFWDSFKTFRVITSEIHSAE